MMQVTERDVLAAAITALAEARGGGYPTMVGVIDTFANRAALGGVPVADVVATRGQYAVDTRSYSSRNMNNALAEIRAGSPSWQAAVRAAEDVLVNGSMAGITRGAISFHTHEIATPKSWGAVQPTYQDGIHSFFTGDELRRDAANYYPGLPTIDIDELDDVIAPAFELRAAVAQNSKTFPRQVLKEGIDARNEPGVVGSLTMGEPVKAAKKAVQAATGNTEEFRRATSQRMLDEINHVLTHPRGAAAVQMIRDLDRATALTGQAPAIARMLRTYVTGAVAGGGYPAIERPLAIERSRKPQ